MEITTLKKNTIMMKNNNTKMETQIIIKRGNFTLTRLTNSELYSIRHKDIPKWFGEFNELFYDELRFYIFEIESDPNKAADFIITLYDWLSSQQEALEKLLDEIYIEK